MAPKPAARPGPLSQPAPDHVPPCPQRPGPLYPALDRAPCPQRPPLPHGRARQLQGASAPVYARPSAVPEPELAPTAPWGCVSGSLAGHARGPVRAVGQGSRPRCAGLARCRPDCPPLPRPRPRPLGRPPGEPPHKERSTATSRKPTRGGTHDSPMTSFSVFVLGVVVWVLGAVCCVCWCCCWLLLLAAAGCCVRCCCCFVGHQKRGISRTRSPRGVVGLATWGFASLVRVLYRVLYLGVRVGCGGITRDTRRGVSSL